MRGQRLQSDTADCSDHQQRPTGVEVRPVTEAGAVGAIRQEQAKKRGREREGGGAAGAGGAGSLIAGGNGSRCSGGRGQVLFFSVETQGGGIGHEKRSPNRGMTLATSCPNLFFLSSLLSSAN